MSKQISLQPGRPRNAAQLTIPPGLDHLPRQIGMFPAFRAALLEDASASLAWQVAGWRGRESRDGGDFGMMLLEMFACLCDIVSFYDSYIAGESYLRTALREEDADRLIRLIGYTPRPAIAAIADLALTLSGRSPVTLTQYSAFRSGKFDDEKPQTFTLMHSRVLHPLRSRFTLLSQPAGTYGTSSTVTSDTLTCDTSRFSLRVGDKVIISIPNSGFAREVTAIADGSDPAGYPVKLVTLNQSVQIPASTAISDIQIHAHTATASLWAYSEFGRYAFFGGQVRLESVNRSIRVGDDIMLAREDDQRWFNVTKVQRLTGTTQYGETITVKDKDGNVTSRMDTPNLTAEMTALTLDVSLNSSQRRDPQFDNWDNDIAEEVTLYYGFKSAARIVGARNKGITATDILRVSEKVESVDDAFKPDHFILRDLDDRALLVGGALQNDGTLNINANDAWDGERIPPVTVYGTIAQVVRGERVSGELLGIGDGSISNQSFTLKKKFLTFINAPESAEGSGYKSTLTIHVDGIQWHEVPRFYGVAGDASVYTVRMSADGSATITFGDGIRGARLPGGTRVVADYFFGAGAAAPPAHSITQMLNPVKNLVAVTNPLPAYGGADAESADAIRKYAPRSALMLGRAVSLLDYEAVSAGVSGVRLASAEWQWSAARQRALVHIWYIAEGNLDALILDRLRAVSALGVPFQIAQAAPRPYNLTVSILTHPDYIADDVAADVLEALTGKDGFLLPERIGINRPLIRSRILERVARVEGVLVPAGLTIDGQVFSSALIPPETGTYFKLHVTVSAQPAPSGSLEGLD